MENRVVIDVTGERVFVEANAEAAAAKLAELLAQKRDAFIPDRVDMSIVRRDLDAASAEIESKRSDLVAANKHIAALTAELEAARTPPEPQQTKRSGKAN